MFKLSQKSEVNKESQKILIYWLLLMVIMIASDIGLIILKSKTEVIVVSICISAFCAIMGIYVIKRFYRDIVKPAKTLEKTGDSTLEIRLARVRKRKRGRDMYEIVDSYRRGYFFTLAIIIGVATLLVMGAMILKLNEYDNINIPFYWGIIISIVIMIISVFAARKQDLFFLSGRDLKSAIEQRGFDEIRVNNDFMMANYHEMFKGMMAVGISYYVVFMQKFCYVGEISSISKIGKFSVTQKLDKTKITRCFIRIYEKNGTINRLMCGDRISQELIARDFQSKGFEVVDEEL